MNSLENALQMKPPEGDAKQRWDRLRDTTTARHSLSPTGSKGGLGSGSRQKRAALLEHKRQPTQSTPQALGEARGNMQRTARSESIQLATDRETSGMSTTVSTRPPDQDTARQLYSNELLVKPSQTGASKWKRG